MADEPKRLRDLLASSREEAMDLAVGAGKRAALRALTAAEADLARRLHQAPGLRGAGGQTFTRAQMELTLRQVRDTVGLLSARLQGATVAQALRAAEAAGGGTLAYMRAAEHLYRGVGQPLPLREALTLDAATAGAEASVLRRLRGEGEPGVLARYSAKTVAEIEKSLQVGLLARKPWAEVRGEVVEASPFLQGAPAHWAERIVRNETMFAYNKGQHASAVSAQTQLGDVVRILCATFDDRTAADSYAVHGQIRRTLEMFVTWQGPMLHPPARPNDREIVVAHRLAWPIPAALRPRTRSDVVERWAREGRKGTPPPTPPMTTIPLSRFARG